MPSITLKHGALAHISISTATATDIHALIALNTKWQKATLQDISNGYVGAAFSKDTFTELIHRRQVVVAYNGGTLAGYYLLNDYSKEGIIGRHAVIVQQLKNTGTIDNDLQIIPGAQAVVDEPYMSSGIRKMMLDKLAENIHGLYHYMFATIAKDNTRAFKAHTRDGWQIAGEEEQLYYVLYPVTL